jgi:hypothetical protein
LPLTNRFTMLADLRMRIQGCNESLRSYLTEAGTKLKAMNYPRELSNNSTNITNWFCFRKWFI